MDEREDHLPNDQKKTRSKFARTVTLLLLIPIALLVGVNLFAICCQSHFIFARAYAGQPEDPIPSDAEVIEVTAPNGDTVVGWYFNAATESDPTPSVVIYFHGNGELVDQIHFVAETYNELGVSVLLVEYRGYGRSEGTPSQRAFVEDGIAFRQRLLDRDDVDPNRIYYHGRSLGGGTAAQLAARHEPAGLIIESSFTSVVSMAGRYLVAPFLVRHPFRSDRVVPQLECPLLVLHGEDDTLIPPSHGRRLAELAKNSMISTGPGGHNTYPRDPEPYWRAISEFVNPGLASSTSPVEGAAATTD